MNVWWSPGQSDAAQQIVSQLSRREKAVLFTLSVLYAVCCLTAPMLIMGSTIGAGPFQDSLAGFTFPLVVCFVACALAMIALQWRLLLRTQVARDNGFTMADLTAKQPLPRSDCLKLGGIAALAIGLGGLRASFLIAV